MAHRELLERRRYCRNKHEQEAQLFSTYRDGASKMTNMSTEGQYSSRAVYIVLCLKIQRSELARGFDAASWRAKSKRKD